MEIVAAAFPFVEMQFALQNTLLLAFSYQNEFSSATNTLFTRTFSLKALCIADIPTLYIVLSKSNKTH